MRWLHEYYLRWRALLKRRQLDRDLDDEIRFHLEMRAERNRESGMTSRDAHDSAQRQFGNPVLRKESIREMWSMGTIESVAQDVRYAVRSMRKSPAFVTAAVLVLALGIGSTTAIFSMVNSVLLRSLPYEDPDGLVVLWGNVMRQKLERRGASYPDYQDWKSQSTSFEGMAAYDGRTLILTTKDGAEQVEGEMVAPGYFELLRVRPVVGRTIGPDEDRPGSAARVALISEGFRKRHFSGENEILGRQLVLNQQQFTVIGVLPEGFRGLTDGAEIWIPFTAGRDVADLASRGHRDFAPLARLKPGVSVQRAQVEMDGISKRLELGYPDSNGARAVEVSPLSTETVGALRTPLMVLLGAVGFVLLVACANVANLLLVRAEGRRQEIAIRAALGASRTRVLRQLLTESVVLSFTGAALGLGLAYWAIRVLTSTSPISLPSFADPQIDWAVAALTMVVSVAVGIIVGLAPVMQAAKQDVHASLKESSSRSGDSVARHRVRGALVVSEVAVAMTLLIGAGLLMRSFVHLSAIEPGFDPNNVLAIEVSIPQEQTPPAEATPDGTVDRKSNTKLRQIVDRIRALPSVTSASIASDYPFSGSSSAIRLTVEGHMIADAQTRPRAYRHRVSPDFFATLRIPLVAGRTFTEAEVEGGAPVAVVTENMTRRYWPGENPIGKRIKSGGNDSPNPWWTIVGVVREMKYRGLPDNPTADPDVFLPSGDRQYDSYVLMRSSGDAGALAGAVRQAIREIDRAIVVHEAATLPERIGRSMERPRFASWMMGVFAVLALMLASVGLYGLMAYTVRQRTREYGIRIAMGATIGDVTRMVVRKGMTLVAIGIGLGAALAFALARAIGTMLYGVTTTDPVTFFGVAAVLALVALVACYLPAYRASRVDPITALRQD